MEFWYIDIALLVFILILCIIVVKLNKRIKLLTDTTDANNIEQLIIEYYSDITTIKNENSNMLNMILKNQENFKKTLCKYDIIRYNPLDEVGGELSFVLTCLDVSNSGFILNSIYMQNFSQVYIKPIENGFSDINLSYEEMESLKRAINKKI